MKKIYSCLATILLLTTGLSQIDNSIPINGSTSPSVLNVQLNQPPNNNSNNNNGHSCKTHELTQQHYQEQGLWNQFNQDYLNAAQQVQGQSIHQSKTPGSNTISVIFHVIHEGEAVGTGTNVSNAAIMAVFDDIVEDFSLTNADQANARTGLGFTPANPGINFCLATQDPSGAPLSETGVTRFQTSKTWFDSDDNTEVNAMKSAPFGTPIWDRNNYLNVYICDITNGANFGTAGYAYRPTTSFLPNSAIDGIVLDYNLGVNNSNVLTHEIGHYLGLDHTWGGSGSCSSDDGFTDTPNTIGPSQNNSGSCSGSQQLCGSTEAQYENYMDYSNCTVMFTTEQSAFMNVILSGIRSSLLLSPGCDPAGPPVSAFTSVPASPVIIPQNATVNFYDQSTSNPTGWQWTISGIQGTDWNYVGGTNNTSEDPQVTFYNVGTYDVSLTASNGIGTGTTASQTSYVTVVPPATGTACDTLRNFNLNEIITYYNNGGNWGYLGGHGEIFPGAPIDEWAEPYTATASSQVRRLFVPFMTVADVSNAGTVNFYVRADAGGTPGAILATESVTLASLNDFAYNTIDFTTPATVTGQFWIGMEVFYGSQQDTVVVAQASLAGRPAGIGTTNMREGTLWYNTSDYYAAPGINLSLAWDVLLSNGPAPSATFSANQNSVCAGGDILVDASGSTNTTSYQWYKTDDPITTIIETSTTSSNTFNFPGPAGDYLILFEADGSCQSDGLVALQVTVMDPVTANATVTATTCGNNNGSVTFTGASGGDGTYYYSLDDVTYQTSNTFNNLPAGNYTGYIGTLGGDCNATVNFTIGASTPLTGTATSAVSICPGDNTTLTATGGGTYQWYDGTTLLGTGPTQLVSPSVQTQYSVQITNGGCTDLQYSNVTVSSLDDASFSFSDFCVGSPNAATGITTSGGIFSLTVNPNGATIDATTGEISGEAAGNVYTVQYSVSNTCPNTSTQSVTVSTSDSPTFTTGNFCAGGNNTVTITGTTGGTFTYDGADASTINATTGVISNGVAGTTYNITYATTGTCGATSTPTPVSVNIIPGVTAGSNQTICSGTAVTLTATNPDGAVITWDNGIVDGTPFTPGVGSATYTATATLAGCTNTSPVTITVDQTPSTFGGNDQTVCLGDMVTLTATNPNSASLSWNNGISDGVAFTPSLGTTSYAVTATLGSCIFTDLVDVIVNDTPSVDAGLDTTLCEGSSLTLTAANPDGGVITWTNGISDGTAFTVGAGSITYIVTSTLGSCSSTSDIVVTGNGAPVVNGLVTNDNGTTNGAIDITIGGGTGPITISWAPNGETTEDLSSLSAGTYTITLTDSLGCSSVTDFTVLSTVGIEDQTKLNEELLIFPNPTQGDVNITLSGEYDLTILDSRGRLLLQKSEVDNSTLNISQYEAGVYFIRIQKEGASVMRKIILK